VVVEVFLDAMCPFSGKMLRTMMDTVMPKLGQNMKLIVYNYVQTWHFSSVILAKAAIAAGQVCPDKYFPAFRALVDVREAYLEEACCGKTYCQIMEELGSVVEGVGIDKQKFMERADVKSEKHTDVVNEVKLHTKYGRQNSIHVTPTVIINGLIDPAISSSWGLPEWEERLKYYKEQAIPVQP